jgi:hypothetical protein
VTTPAGDNGGDVPAVVVVSVAVIIVALIGGITALTYAGKNSTPLVTAAGVLSPFIIALLAVRNSHRAERHIAEVQHNVADVREKVNGKLDGLILDKTNLEHQVSVAGLTPVTATVSFDPESTGDHPIVGSDLPETEPPTNPYHVGELLRRLNDERENDGR